MSLSKLFVKSLSAASKASNLSTVESQTQELIQSCLKDLKMIQSRLAALSVFSPNESLEDIGTKDLAYLFVPYVQSEVLDRIKTTGITERLQVLEQAQRLLRDFSSSVENYDIVPEMERTLHQRKASAIRDPKQKREIKIMQYKKEKELRAKLEAIRDRRGWRSVTSDSGSDFDLISMLLPSGANSRPSEDEDEDELDSEAEDALREAILVLLRLLYTQGQTRMDNIEQEFDLLRNAPADRAPAEDVPQEQRRTADDNMWRVEPLQPIDRGGDGKGPLIDSSGKPLRPFTILPSEAADRARLQSQVFGPSHRLPTMTIDDYLEIERQRGNILSGGGRASQEAPTSTEKLTLAAEMDGTRESEEVEELRQKQEKWAQFTEANPRGAGNTMNRG
ncbi:TAP42-like protein [Amanita rubescens]|nr:TAP42-like protein [Amanita rubescens]